MARVDAAQPPVGRDDGEAGDVVGGQPERARGEPVAAAEREPAEADGRARAAGHRAAVARERVDDLDHVRARADARAPAAAVDRDRAQAPQVDDDAVVDRRVAGVGVAARARRDADVVAVGPAQHGLDVAAVERLDDRVGPGAVVAPVVDAARRRRTPSTPGRRRGLAPAARARAARAGRRRPRAGPAAGSQGVSRAGMPSASRARRAPARRRPAPARGGSGGPVRVAGGRVPGRRRASGPPRAPRPPRCTGTSPSSSSNVLPIVLSARGTRAARARRPRG